MLAVRQKTSLAEPVRRQVGYTIDNISSFARSSTTSRRRFEDDGAIPRAGNELTEEQNKISTDHPGVEALAKRIIGEVRPYTMVPDENLTVTIGLVLDAIESGRTGDIVECGAWFGGSSFAMLLAQRYAFGRIVKPVWMFDSFEGLPKAETRDGQMALQYQAATDAPGYLDNCRAPLDQVQEAARKFGFSDDEAIIVPGWFEETLPRHVPKLSELGISVLRIDCDWYAPVSLVLDQLAQLVPEEGAIILDDYFAWDGCARATHDFLSRNDLCWRVRSMDRFTGAWIVKRLFRRNEL